ncbi:hypothetical protein AVEN_223371-1 [Araneus ventricosus]|uniref:Uncharacterized protein n=1 Tax=Araneus ventricosus TaxID=182803 RepID=A0A4Y2QQG1_ARAVE|nr:hypothetical protein AVEN_223371-1 [Araneus ventricosus]
MTRTTPELAPPFSNFITTPARGHLAPKHDIMWNSHTHDGPSVESGFETGPLLPEAETLPQDRLTFSHTNRQINRQPQLRKYFLCLIQRSRQY